jgi:hypothetical protein
VGKNLSLRQLPPNFDVSSRLEQSVGKKNYRCGNCRRNDGSHDVLFFSTCLVLSQSQLSLSTSLIMFALLLCMLSISAYIAPYPVHVDHTIKQSEGPMSVLCIVYSVTLTLNFFFLGSHGCVAYPADLHVEQYSTSQQTIPSSFNVRHLDIMYIVCLFNFYFSIAFWVT